MSRVETIGRATLYLGDCAEVMASWPECFRPGAVVTDPPYPDYLAEEFGYDEQLIRTALAYECPQFVFWSAKATFPLDHSAIHIWHKTGAGNIASYERIFERHGGKAFKVYRGNCISNPTMAIFAKDEWFDHPTQKPVSLMRQLVSEAKAETILDPFMGSGTTGVAAVQMGKAFIGIEREPRYFDIACRRIEEAQRQGDFFVSAA